MHRKLAQKEEVVPRVQEPDFVTGETFRYLGRSYRLKIVADQEAQLRCNGSRFYLRGDARDTAEELFRRWYISVGTPWIAKQTAQLSRRVGRTPARVEVRDLGFRWGSCASNRVLLFNWRLLQFPARLVDYVIAHKLGFIRPHHGPEFWRALDRSLPDWRRREEELRREVANVFGCQGEMVRGTKHVGLVPREMHSAPQLL